VLTERDRPVPTSLQEEMIGRLPRPPRVVRLDSGHLPPVTSPRSIAAIITSAKARQRAADQ
jgi:pimeloyl-ACP methyl ester carboxylesterase